MSSFQCDFQFPFVFPLIILTFPGHVYELDTPDSKLPACYCFYKYSARASAVLPGSLKESLSNKHVVLIY